MKIKKAQANIIALVLIILLVLVVGVVVWNLIYGLTREKSKETEASAEVLTVDLEVSEVALFVTGALKVKVKRNTGKGNIDELRFVFYDKDGNSDVLSGKKEDGIPDELETKIYSFGPVQNLGKIERISVVPVLDGEMGREFKSEIGKILEVPEGLISWWKFDGNAEDFVGSNNGNLQEGVSFIEDLERGEVADFNGGRIDCGKGVGLSIREQIAISAWVKTDFDDGFVIKKSNGNKNYEIFLEEGRVNFIYTSDGELKSGESISEVSDGEWHHIAISEDWTGNENLMIYIDGVLDNMVNMTGSPDVNTESVFIGENYNGYMDEVMIFNKSLSFSQVGMLYNNQKM